MKTEYHLATIIDGNVGGKGSLNAANAALCAQDTGKFRDYHDVLYSNQPPEPQDKFADKKYLIQLAGKVKGLVTDNFTRCVNEGTYDGFVQKSNSAFATSGYRGTPTVLLNGKDLAKAKGGRFTPADLKKVVQGTGKGKKPGHRTRRPCPDVRRGLRTRSVMAWDGGVVTEPLPGGLSPTPPGAVASTLPWTSHSFPARRPVSYISARSRCAATHSASSSASSSASGSATSAGSSAVAAPGPSRTSPCGPCPSGSSADASTTSSRRTSRTSARAATPSTPSRCGKAASGSGARSRSARSAPGSAAADAASRCPPTPTRWRPASLSGRRSAAGATGSTRSSTAAPPTCRGRWRSAPTRRSAGSAAPTTPPSSTSPCGASVSRCW